MQADTLQIASLAALGSAGTWAVASLLVDRMLRERAGAPGAAAVNFFKNTAATILFVSVFALAGNVMPGGRPAALLVLSGVFGFALSDTCYFAALPRCGVQTTGVVYISSVPLAAVFSYLFLDEALAARTVLFMGVALLGVLVVVTDRRDVRGRPEVSSRRTGILLAVAAALAQALSVVIGHRALESVEIVPGIVVRLIGGLGGALVLAVACGAMSRRGAAREVGRLVGPLARPSVWKPLFLPTLFGALLGLPLYTLALRDAPGGVSTLFFTTTPLFTLPLGLLFGVRAGRRAIAGTLIGFAGVCGVIASMS